jgi:hypothetical protein
VKFVNNVELPSLLRTMNGRRRLAAPLVGVIVLAFAGVSCSEEQQRDVEGAAVVTVLEERTLDVLDEQNVDLDGELDCSADIADDGAVTGTCTGTTDAGDPVTATLDGTVEVEDAECSSSVTVSVAGEVIAEDADFDCLK